MPNDAAGEAGAKLSTSGAGSGAEATKAAKAGGVRTAQRDSRWLPLGLSLLLLILVAFGAYYFFYIAERNQLLDRFHLRLLSTAAQNIAERLEERVSNVQNAADKACGEKLRSKLRLIPLLEETTGPASSTTAEVTDSKPAAQEVEVSLNASQVPPRLEFHIQEGLRPDGTICASDTQSWSLDLQAFVEPALPSEAFESIVLARGDGTAMFLTSPGGNSFLDLRRLPDAAPADEADADKSDTPSQGAPVGTEIRETEIAGVAYKIYVQPIRLPIRLNETFIDEKGVGSHPLNEHWLLAGLVPVSEVRSSAMLISTDLVVAVIGLLVVGLLSIPYLRIRFIGRREVIRAHDVLILLFAVVVLCSALTLTIVDWFGYRDWAERGDEQLATLAKEIRAHVAVELEQMELQLAALTAAAYPESGCPATSESEVNILARLEQLADYPFLEVSFWADAAGTQLCKWTARQTLTAAVLVEDRDYFKAARDERLWPSGSGSRTKPSPFTEGRYVQSTISKTTGQVGAVVAKRMREDRELPKPPTTTTTTTSGAAKKAKTEASATAEKLPPLVAAIQSSMLSLIDPVLPSGFGFAVLGDDGTVLFHSNKERNLRENFLHEIDRADASRVQSAILERTSETMDATYRTRSLRLNVAPMEALPWTLVVFRDNALIRTFHLEVVTTCAVLLISYLLLFGLTSAWLYVVGRHAANPGAVRSAWYWPTPSGVVPCLVLTAVSLVLLTSWGLAGAWGVEFDFRHAAYQAIAAVCLMLWLPRLDPASGESASTPRRMRQAGLIGIAVGALAPLCTVAANGAWARLPLLLAAILVALIALLKPRRLELALALVIAAGLYATAQPSGAPSPAALVISSVLVVVLWLPWKQWREAPPKVHAQLRARWRDCHVLCWVSMLNLVAVVPSVCIYRTAFDGESELAVKHDQLMFARALGERARAIAERFEDIVLYDLPAGDASADVEQPAEPSPVAAELQSLLPYFDSKSSATDSTAKPPLDVYPESPASKPEESPASKPERMSIEPWLLTRERVEAPDPPARSKQTLRWTASLFDALQAGLPYYNEFTQRLRGLARSTDQQHDGWTWWRDQSGNLSLWYPKYRWSERLGLIRERGTPPEQDTLIKPRRPDDAQRVSLLVTSHVPTFGIAPTIGLILVCGLTLAALIVLLRSIALRVFLSNFKRPVMLRGDEILGKDVPRLRLLLRPIESMTKQLESDPASFVLASTRVRHESTEKLVGEIRGSNKPRVVLQLFEEGLDEPDVSDRKLELLDALVANPAWQVIVCSELDPMYFINQRLSDSWADSHPGQLDRWAVVLGEFDKVRGDADEMDARERRARYENELCEFCPDVARNLAAECWPTPVLRNLGVRLAQRKDARTLSREQIVEVVLDRMESHYRQTWSTCSTEEKVLLHRLAQEGFVNWQIKATLQRLVRRGLVYMGAGFPLMNESFRLFVLRAERPEVFRAWERDAGIGVWERVRTPLMLAMIIMAAFFFVTQRGTFNQTLTIVGALAASVPVLVKLLSATTQRREG